MFINDLLRGILGMVVLLGICFAFSKKRSAIDWRLVGIGLSLQIALALLILEVPQINAAFDWLAKAFTQLIAFTDEGSRFMFGYLIDNITVNDSMQLNYIIAFKVLPTIVFFSVLTAILYYLGVLQQFIKAFAWVMRRTMRLTGTESLATAANVFIGQTEAPLVVKPYLENMTRSQLLCLMIGGMSTIAGSVFGIYVIFLGGNDMQEFYGKHLLVASIISAPAAIVVSKMLYPEIEEDKTAFESKLEVDAGSNLLDAISRGTADGLRLAVNVGVMLLVFTALIYMMNQILMNGPGEWLNLNEKIQAATNERFEGLTFTYLLSLVFMPIAWLLGTPMEDVQVMGHLIGLKTVINEFIAYQEFNSFREAGIALHPKTMIIATYALCGFANFASIGIQIGGIGAIAPKQRQTLTELGMIALVGGTIASFMTAIIAGIIVQT